MIICGSSMFGCSVSKDMKSMFHRVGGGSKQGSGTYIKELEISVEQGWVVIILNVSKH